MKIFIFFVGKRVCPIFRPSLSFDPKGHYRKVINTVGLSWELGQFLEGFFCSFPWEERGGVQWALNHLQKD